MRTGIRIEGKLSKDVIISSCTIQITDKALKGSFCGIDALTTRGLILNHNTIANNSTTTEDYGIILGPKVKGVVVSGNIYHLASKHLIQVDPAATEVKIDGKDP